MANIGRKVFEDDNIIIYKYDYNGIELEFKESLSKDDLSYSYSGKEEVLHEIFDFITYPTSVIIRTPESTFYGNCGLNVYGDAILVQANWRTANVSAIVNLTNATLSLSLNTRS